MIYLLAILLLVLFLSWRSYSNHHLHNNEKLVYMDGNQIDPDSDADMQEQYGYQNEKNHDK